MSVLTARRGDMCYCPGCSHGMVLEQLGAAIDALGLPPERLCIVSDIGCIGTADRYFSCHTFHGLHGRSITYAEGIKRARPEMLVVVLIGDGGCGIGTAHLIHAARRSADIKVIVCNNFNFGMTGGQHSATTPITARTTTTPDGAPDHPFDLCTTVGVNGAAYAARHSAFDDAMVENFRRALTCPGFVLVDVWELCTAYFVPANKLSRGSLEEYSTKLGLPFGVLRQRSQGDGAGKPVEAAPARPKRERAAPVSVAASLAWPGRREICVAGSAGQRIRSAVGVIGEIAVGCGLYAAQQDDFPITVRRGFSLSNLIIACTPIRYTSLDAPNLVVVLSTDGLERFGSPAGLAASSLLVTAEGIPVGDTPARVRVLPLKTVEKRVGKESAALAALTCALLTAGLVDAGELRAAADALVGGAYRQTNLEAIAAGLELAAEAAPVAAR